MPDKPWKAHERRTAKRLGGVRTPLSGSASHHTSADIIHPTLYIECKYRKTFAILSAMHRVEANEEKEQRNKELRPNGEKKPPVLILQERGAKRAYALISIGNLTTAFPITSGICASRSETSIQTPLTPPRDQPKKPRERKSHQQSQH